MINFSVSELRLFWKHYQVLNFGRNILLNTLDQSFFFANHYKYEGFKIERSQDVNPAVTQCS